MSRLEGLPVAAGTVIVAWLEQYRSDAINQRQFKPGSI